MLPALVLLLASAAVSAQQTASNPSPPLNSDFLITLTPAQTPWTDGASIVQGSSTAVGNSVARITYGACVYRALHWHSFAWEALTPVTPGLSLTSVMEEPSNYGGLTRTDQIAPGQSLTYPAGWVHLQLNDNCASLDAVAVFNAVNSGGTANVPSTVAAIGPAYDSVAWVGGLPPAAGGAGQWVLDAGCAARCGLPFNSSLPKGYALKAKLATAAGMVASSEQLAAAKASALFGAGVKESVERGVGSKVAALTGAAWNKTV
jgi:hypothetical protein